jgi:hypothetical protein
MASAHTHLQAHADPIRALAETCALLGRKGWTFTSEATEPTADGSCATVLRSHAFLRAKRPEGFAQGAPSDTFVVLVSTTIIPAYGSRSANHLSAYIVAFRPRRHKEGPITSVGLAECTDADLYPEWVPPSGFRTPADFAAHLAGVVAVRLV